METPIGKVTVVINKWITGREAEYIQEPITGSVQLKGLTGTAQDVGVDSEKFQKAIRESAHREIESYVVKVGDETDQKKCVDLILDAQKEDTDFVLNTIAELKKESKKKISPKTT